MERRDKRLKRGVQRPKAATKEVLGTEFTETRIAPKWKRHYQRLTEMRGYLLNRKGDLVKDAREEQPTFSLHMADAGTDEFDRNFALSMISSEQNALYEIEQALNRIRLGTYGVCEMTGKPIEPERLDAIPWARFSADAERQLEREGSIGRVRLGDRERVPQAAAEEESAEEEET